ncbi:MAG TPA: YncE family protein [Steroidobacteraceae bacterium]|nr:YncE family protein [Steroidobacteraceae bacterium]
MRLKFTRIRPAGLALIAALAAATTAGSAPADSTFQVLQRWKLGGAGGWDYLTLDAAGKRLFLSRATRVDVVSTESGKVIGTIPNTLGVHGIALAEDSQRGYTSNGKADSVTVFDAANLTVIREVKIAGHNPDAILYEPVGKHVFTFNGKSKDVTVLDAASLEVVATLPVPDKPEFAVDDANGHIFVNIESEEGQMTEIDSRKLTVIRSFPLPGCASPSGLAIDRAHHRLFSVCDAKTMAVTDADTGKQVARVPIGEGPDAAAFDPKRGLVFSSNGEGTLTVVRQDTADRYTVQAAVPTQRGARTMALDAAGGKVYLVTADFGPPPAASAEQPHPRPVPIPDTFTMLVVGTR